jgi:hypothetical protein
MDLLKGIGFDDDYLVFGLNDGRFVAAPLAWFPRLASASKDQREEFELSPFGVHWAGLDEDISLEGVLHGASPNRWDASAKNELLFALERLVEDGTVEND